MTSKVAILVGVLGGGLMALPTVSAAPEAVLTAQARPGTIIVAPGAKTLVKVRLTVRHEYHVSANPPSTAYLIPTTVGLAKAPGVTVGKPLYPKATLYTSAFAPKAIKVYQDSVMVTIPLSVSAQATPGSRQLIGIVKYQPCKATLCLAPMTAKFAVTLQIAKPGH